MTELTAATIPPEIQESIDNGDMRHSFSGELELTEQGELRARATYLESVLVQAVAMHRAEIAKWRIHDFLLEQLMLVTDDA